MRHARPALEDRLAPDPGGADQSFRALVDEHFDFIWRQLRRMGLSGPDADDASQQVFMIAMRKLDAVVPGSERSFLYGAAVRVSANARRSARRLRGNAATHERAALEATPEQPDGRVELKRAWALLDELLGRLPEELARVLVLAEIEQLAVSEIAQLEALAIGTAASRLRRAREKFHALIDKESHRNPFARGSE